MFQPIVKKYSFPINQVRFMATGKASKYVYFSSKKEKKDIKNNNNKNNIKHTPIFDGGISHNRKTVKPLDSRKTYLVDMYTHLLRTSEVLLLVQHNNLSSADNFTIRQAFNSTGGTFTVIKGKVFKVALRNGFHKDPTSQQAELKSRMKRNENNKLFSDLVSGPLSLVHYDKFNSKQLSRLTTIFKSFGGKILLVGAKVDNQIVDTKGLNELRKLGSIEQQRSELLGLLTLAGGAGLVSLLQQPSLALLMNLEGYGKQLEESK